IEGEFKQEDEDVNDDQKHDDDGLRVTRLCIAYGKHSVVSGGLPATGSEIGVSAPFGPRHQGADLVQAGDAAAGSDRGAVERRHGVRKVESLGQGHSLQNSIAE